MRAHPDYHDLQPWNGVETADFVYTDSESVFTHFLVEKGFLPLSWNAARPQYYIEVKSTVSAFKTPFYMSKGQFRRVCLLILSCSALYFPFTRGAR